MKKSEAERDRVKIEALQKAVQALIALCGKEVTKEVLINCIENIKNK